MHTLTKTRKKDVDINEYVDIPYGRRGDKTTLRTILTHRLKVLRNDVKLSID